MINAPKATKAINKFQYVALPSPRDVFARYGERLSNRGEYSTSSDEYADPSLVSSSSRIDEILNADMMLRGELERMQKSHPASEA